MITTIVLANTSIMSQKTTISFSVARTFKIYSLSNFQVCHTVLLVIITMLYIRFLRNCQSYNWQFVPFDRLVPIPPNIMSYSPSTDLNVSWENKIILTVISHIFSGHFSLR